MRRSGSGRARLARAHHSQIVVDTTARGGFHEWTVVVATAVVAGNPLGVSVCS